MEEIMIKVKLQRTDLKEVARYLYSEYNQCLKQEKFQELTKKQLYKSFIWMCEEGKTIAQYHQQFQEEIQSTFKIQINLQHFLFVYYRSSDKSYRLIDQEKEIDEIFWNSKIIDLPIIYILPKIVNIKMHVLLIDDDDGEDQKKSSHQNLEYEISDVSIEKTINDIFIDLLLTQKMKKDPSKYLCSKVSYKNYFDKHKNLHKTLTELSNKEQQVYCQKLQMMTLLEIPLYELNINFSEPVELNFVIKAGEINSNNSTNNNKTALLNYAAMKCMGEAIQDAKIPEFEEQKDYVYIDSDEEDDDLYEDGEGGLNEKRMEVMMEQSLKDMDEIFQILNEDDD